MPIYYKNIFTLFIQKKQKKKNIFTLVLTLNYILRESPLYGFPSVHDRAPLMASLEKLLMSSIRTELYVQCKFHEQTLNSQSIPVNEK